MNNFRGMSTARINALRNAINAANDPGVTARRMHIVPNMPPLPDECYMPNPAPYYVFLRIERLRALNAIADRSRSAMQYGCAKPYGDRAIRAAKRDVLDAERDDAIARAIAIHGAINRRNAGINAAKPQHYC